MATADDRSTEARLYARFLDAYLVTEDEHGAPPVGVVRKDRNVWRIMRFGIPDDQQPREVWATRREAGAHLLALSRQTGDD
jgi:hypothetical protein